MPNYKQRRIVPPIATVSANLFPCVSDQPGGIELGVASQGTSAMPDYELILVGRGSRQPVKTVTCAHDMEALRRAAALLREGLEVEVREGIRIVGSLDRAPRQCSSALGPCCRPPSGFSVGSQRGLSGARFLVARRWGKA
jgi:hypothetical protein